MYITDVYVRTWKHVKRQDMITGWWYEHLNDATSLSPVERRIVDSFLYVFQSSVLFSARATSQEVMFTSLTENWLTQIYRLMKTRTRGKYIQLQALQQVGSGASSPHQRISLHLRQRQDASIYLCWTGKEFSTMHQTYMSCQSQLEQSTAQILHQYFPTL